MKKARIIGKETLLYSCTCYNIEWTVSYSMLDWMQRNGLQETEAVETEDGRRFMIYANYARHLACAVPV